jgi:hypothetical protein
MLVLAQSYLHTLHCIQAVVDLARAINKSHSETEGALLVDELEAATIKAQALYAAIELQVKLCALTMYHAALYYVSGLNCVLPVLLQQVHLLLRHCSTDISSVYCCTNTARRRVLMV